MWPFLGDQGLINSSNVTLRVSESAGLLELHEMVKPTRAKSKKQNSN
jgi:hypothetical protein